MVILVLVRVWKNSHVGGPLPEVVAHPGSDHGDDRAGQLEGAGGPQSAALQPPDHFRGVDERRLEVDRGVERAVHGDQHARPDKLVELDVVDVLTAGVVTALWSHTAVFDAP
jgi:hypothetical protein